VKARIDEFAARLGRIGERPGDPASARRAIARAVGREPVPLSC
jgi:hypothetical protein